MEERNTLNDYILRQQFPEPEEALRLAEESLHAFENKTSPSSSSSCPHLAEYLPDQLDLTFCKTNDGWLLRNPVHALHLVSQLDPSWIKTLEEDPILYGEEQERLIALLTEGLPETWHPWIHEMMEVRPETDEENESKPLNVSSNTVASAPAAAIATIGEVQPTWAPPASAPPLVPKTEPLEADMKDESSMEIVVSIPLGSKPHVPVTTQVPTTAPAPTPSAPKPLLVTSATVVPPPVPSATIEANSLTTGLTPPATTRVEVSKPPTGDRTATIALPAESTEPVVAQAVAAAAPAVSSNVPVSSKHYLSESRYWSLFAHEEQIRALRRALLSKRAIPKKQVLNKKRKTETKLASIMHSGAWKHDSTDHARSPLTPEEVELWKQKHEHAKRQVDWWVEHYRMSREAYWRQQPRSVGSDESVPFGMMDEDRQSTQSCQQCRSNQFSGDGLVHCLECTFVGCAPCTIAPESKEHIVQHLLLSNHKFAVTCGPQARIYCFRCGDFVHHEIFDQERDRLDVIERFPWMGWKDHPVQRSFEALRFMRVLDQGIVWRGMAATYPPLVPPEHLEAVRMCRWRQTLFEGNVEVIEDRVGGEAREFALAQSRKGKSERYHIPAPVGMYNLGNTCFMSAILQCLVHLSPVQSYFLQDLGHHYISCMAYRKKVKSSSTTTPPATKQDENLDVCLACEFDKIVLQSFSKACGEDAFGLVTKGFGGCSRSLQRRRLRFTVDRTPLISIDRRGRNCMR